MSDADLIAISRTKSLGKYNDPERKGIYANCFFMGAIFIRDEGQKSEEDLEKHADQFANSSYKIEIGDPSDDGHGRYKIFYVQAAKDSTQAFLKLKERGIDFQEMCEEYQCSNLTSDQVQKLAELGISDEQMNYFKEQDGFVDGPEHYVDLMIECLNLVDTELEMELIKEEYVPSIGTFGYGLLG